MPISRAIKLCPNALCVPVPRECSKYSRAIGAVLGRFTPVVEGASIDEWYLDLSGTEALYKGAPLAKVAHDIRNAVLEETGMTVSIGGGTNRLIAKLAVEHAKPKPGTSADGVHVVPAGGELDFMRGVTLAEIPMVGPRFKSRLDSLGLINVTDVLELEIAALERMLGERAGRWLHDRARGIGSSEVHHREHSVSLSHEETFAHDLSLDAELDVELVRLVNAVARDLRRRGLHARTISIKLRDGDFRTRRASRTLSSPFASDRVILNTARTLLAKLRGARRVPARLLGVSLTSLEKGDSDAQLGLFESEAVDGVDTSRDRAVSKVLDAVRARFGNEAMIPGALTERPGQQRPGRKI